MKYPNITLAQVEAVWDKLGGEQGVAQLLDPDKNSRTWVDKGDYIYFSVTSAGLKGDDLLSRLEAGGYDVDFYARNSMSQNHFRTRADVTTDVVIIKGSTLKTSERTSFNLLKIAKKNRFKIPSPELGSLIRLKYTDKDIEMMGLKYIVVMHEPIEYSGYHYDGFRKERRRMIVRRGKRDHLILAQDEEFKSTSQDRDGWAASCGFAFIAAKEEHG